MSIRVETERLLLREYLSSDWTDVHEYCQDPDVTRFMLWGPNSEEQTRDFLKKAQEHQIENPRHIYEFAVESKENNRVIGGIVIRIRSVEKRAADIGYCYNPRYWGHGYGTEAALAILKFGFEALKLHRIWATCDIENVGSESIMRKNGMRKEAHFKREELIKGHWRDSLLYAMLEEEWLARAADAQSIVCNVSKIALSPI